MIFSDKKCFVCGNEKLNDNRIALCGKNITHYSVYYDANNTLVAVGFDIKSLNFRVFCNLQTKLCDLYFPSKQILKLTFDDSWNSIEIFEAKIRKLMAFM